tara:strand:- start:315 stop:485 length:171 start_codon:yes stop_codon:yes gene_type:complete
MSRIEKIIRLLQTATLLEATELIEKLENKYWIPITTTYDDIVLNKKLKVEAKTRDD